MTKKNPLSEAASAMAKRRNEVLTAAERLKIAEKAGRARRRQLMRMSKEQRVALAKRAAQVRWAKEESERTP